MKSLRIIDGICESQRRMRILCGIVKFWCMNRREQIVKISSIACLGLSQISLQSCSSDSLIPASAMILGGVAVGGAGYLLGNRPEIEIPSQEGSVFLELGKPKALHFQLRIPSQVSLDQNIRISADPADVVEVMEPVLNIASSIEGLPDLQDAAHTYPLFRNKEHPLLKGLKLGKAKVRIEALGSWREVEVQVINPIADETP